MLGVLAGHLAKGSMRLGASAHRELPVNFLLNPASADFADAPTSRQYFDI